MRFSQRFQNDFIGVILTLVALIATVVFSRRQWIEPDSRLPGSIGNLGPDGAQLLYDWLSELGYQVDAVDSRGLFPSGDDSLLFVLAPQGKLTGVEQSSVDVWVQSGGTLIVAQEDNRRDELLAYYGLRLRRLWPAMQHANLQLPTFNWPLVGTAEVQASRRLQLNCGQAAIHIGDCQKAALHAEAAKVIVGQEDVLSRLFIALLANGHALMEGVPGTAKTLMAKTLSHLVQAPLNRIQFTPDLMPSDVIGTNVFNVATSQFHLRRGPIFAGILLADEVNRAPAKTQAALLEAMEERQVTIDGTEYQLPDPFLVIATQNPVEYEGTYPLKGALTLPRMM